MKNEKFVLKLADESHLKYLEQIENENNFKFENIKNLEITFRKINEIRSECKYAIATSGTVTFELALMGLPTIVVYKTSAINAFIARKIVKVKYVSLTNINANKEIFPELLQEDFTVEKLLTQCEKMKKERENILLELEKEREKLGNKGVLQKIGKYLLTKIERNEILEKNKKIYESKSDKDGK